MGEWVVTPRAWYDISVLNCSLCGKMLPGRIWSVEIAGREHIFCDPDCEDVYRHYWHPRYGAAESANMPPGPCVNALPAPLDVGQVRGEASMPAPAGDREAS